MPTTYRPSLNHQPFDWAGQIRCFEKALEEVAPQLFKLLSLNDVGMAKEQQAVLNEMVGALCRAGAISIDAGYKAGNKIKATLVAIKRDPNLIFSTSVEPEALGLIAMNYCRGNEALGTHWYDVTGDAQGIGGLAPQATNIVTAVDRAIAQLTKETKTGRRQDYAAAELAHDLRDIYENFGKTATRPFSDSSRRGCLYRKVGGPFFGFIELAIAPLNKYLASRKEPAFSAATLCLLATKRDRPPRRYANRRAVSWKEATQLYALFAARKT